MVTCCPLSGDHDGGPSCSSIAVRAARKEHDCTECGKKIARGEKYEYSSGVWDGRPDSFKTCLLCAEIRDHFACEGWIYGQIWSDLRDNFFPDMASGGPCMQGLSPAAKQKLIDERMEWYFDQDEIDDSAWEDWPKHRDRQRPLPSPPPDSRTSFERKRYVVDYDDPEIYWPRQLELEKAMKEYEESNK